MTAAGRKPYPCQLDASGSRHRVAVGALGRQLCLGLPVVAGNLYRTGHPRYTRRLRLPSGRHRPWGGRDVRSKGSILWGRARRNSI